MKFLMAVVGIVALLALSACNQDIPNPKLPDEPLETEQPLQTFTSEAIPITLPLENPNGGLQAQASVACTLEHLILVYSTTVKGQGIIRCPEIITYAKMRIVLFRYDNTASVARYVDRVNFLTTFTYSSDTLSKVSGKKYCVDSTLNTLKTVGGSLSILKPYSFYCVTI